MSALRSQQWSPRGLRSLAAVALVAAGCGVGIAPDDVGLGDATPDAADREAASPDVASPDVPGIDATDGGGIDAPVTLPDGGMDAATGCTVNGVRGVCMPVSECTGDRVATPGHCPGPAQIQCCTAVRPDGGARDAGDGWACDPAAMPLPNTDLREEPGAGGCRAGMLRVADFCVDRFEATVALVNADGTLAAWSPYFNPGTRRVRALSVRAAVPQGYITGIQAAAACRDAGKRLCTDAEWLRACRGSTATTYPYGNTRVPGVCNDARDTHPAVEYFGSTASWVYSMLDNACLSQLPESLDRTGTNLGCVTEEGAFDMMGNLHEWTADPAGTFRGGYYADTMDNGDGCLYRTTAHDMNHWDYSTGFRCCADP